MDWNGGRRRRRAWDRDDMEGDLWAIAALGMTTITAIIVGVLSVGID